MKTKIFGFFTFVRTFRTGKLITKCANQIIEFITKMPSNMFTRRISDITNRANRAYREKKDNGLTHKLATRGRTAL